jgi:spermidine/putrescine transport system permease protein
VRSGFLNALALGPAVAPDIVMAIGLLAFFTATGLTLGLHSVLLAHVVFSTAFVAAIVTARLGHTDPSLEEASRDLGATAVATFFRITVPILAPAIVAGALLAFTLSLDEFVIAFFTNGPATPTLPIVIYSMVRFGVTPEINALAAILLLISFTVILAAQRLTGLADRG